MLNQMWTNICQTTLINVALSQVIFLMSAHIVFKTASSSMSPYLNAALLQLTRHPRHTTCGTKAFGSCLGAPMCYNQMFTEKGGCFKLNLNNDRLFLLSENAVYISKKYLILDTSFGCLLIVLVKWVMYIDRYVSFVKIVISIKSSKVTQEPAWV